MGWQRNADIALYYTIYGAVAIVVSYAVLLTSLNIMKVIKEKVK